MTILITSLLVAAIGVTLIFTLRNAQEKTVTKVLRIFSLVMAAVCFFRIVKTQDVFDRVVALDVSKVPALGVMFKNQAVLFIVLRWLTTYSMVFCLLAPWYKIKGVDNMVSLFTPIIVILNIVYLNLNFTCFIGKDAFAWDNANSVLRVVQFICELGMTGGLSAYYLYKKIKDKDWAKLWKQLLDILAMVILYSIIFMPESSLVNLFGPSTYVMDTLDIGNRLLIYSMVITMALMYGYLRNKEEQVRHFVLTSIALGVLISFFYTYSLKFSVYSLPLHLCNAGTILSFFAFAFRNKAMFYFNFLINVLGSAIALIATNTSGVINSVAGIHYYLTHAWLCMLPCLGIALKIFPRPTFKMVKGAVLVFTVYFALMLVLNPWFNNYTSNPQNYIETGKNPGIDYFYVMSDFIPDKIGIAEKFKYGFNPEVTPLNFKVEFKGLTFWLYPVFWLGVYVVYIAMTFGVWFLYDVLFKVGDRHYDMLMRKRRARADLLGIENARRINNETSEPLNKEGMNMIKFSHFTKRYGSAKVKAVDDFNLEIYDGEVFGFIGHNGAGKSTCIKSLVGIQSITEGSIEVCGYDIAKQPLPAKKLLGYVPDNHAVYERLTGREYINYVADLYRVSKQDREERLEKYLEIFKLTGDIDRQIKGYSHGMKQKVVVIAALIHEPKVWVLDEPLTGLDPTSSFQIKECMREHASKGNIVFFSSHVIEVVEKICTRIAIISKGKLQCIHAIKDLAAKGISLEELYMQYVQRVDEEMLHTDHNAQLAETPTQLQQQEAAATKTKTRKTKGK